MENSFLFEASRTLPSYGSFETVVVGGGFSGVAAALSAARNGTKTCLIEKEFSLGGLGTLGLVVDYLPLCDGQGVKMVGGIGEELLILSSKYGKTNFPSCWLPSGDRNARINQRYELTYTPASMILVMEELLLDAGVTLFYDTRFCALSVQDTMIKAVVVENKSGRGAIFCKCVVDATGDADVCVLAGEVTVESDKNVCAWWFYSETDGRLKLNRKTDNFYKLTPEIPLYSGTKHEDVTALCVETRRRIREYTNAVRAGQDSNSLEMSHDGSGVLATTMQSRDQFPAILPSIPQYRMTRRILTDYQLDEADNGRWFDDCVGHAGDWRKSGPRYCIPYRAICARNVDNLLVAGRCISTTDTGWDIMRVIPTCAVTGEAAGTACALAVKKTNGNVHSININELQQLLSKQNVVIDRNLFA